MAQGGVTTLPRMGDSLLEETDCKLEFEWCGGEGRSCAGEKKNKDSCMQVSGSRNKIDKKRLMWLGK